MHYQAKAASVSYKIANWQCVTMRALILFYLGLVLCSAIFVPRLMENMSVKRVIRQISFPGQGSDSSPSKSSSPGGNIPAAPFRFPDSSSTGGSASSHTAPGNCNCQPMVVCISQAYKGLQSCQFPDGNSGVCCPAESPTNSSPNQGAVNDRLFYLLSLFQKPIQHHKASTSRKFKNYINIQEILNCNTR